MFIHRPDQTATEKDYLEGKIKKNVAEIIIAKHRNGPQGVIELYFKGECTKFLNLSDNEAKEAVMQSTMTDNGNKVLDSENQEYSEEVNEDEESMREYSDDDVPPDDNGGLPY